MVLIKNSRNICYKCEIIIDDKNYSSEHIILNACGGRLKSDKLLCKKCNSDFGNSFDSELANDLNPLANLLRINRDRGFPQKIEGKGVYNGLEYYLEHDGKISLKKPIIIENDIHNDDISKRKINVKALNKKNLNQVLKGLKRKYPDLDILKAEEEINHKNELFDEPLNIKMSIGGSDTFKSITKTAINFYILNGGKRNEIKHLFNYLDGKENLEIVWFYYSNLNVYEYKNDEITHVLKIVGKADEKILYAYVELFNTHCFIIKLSENYSEPDMDVDYIFNIHNNEVNFNLTTLDLSRKELINLFIKKEEKPYLKMQDRANRVLNIAHKNDIKRELSKSIDKILNKHIGEKMNDTILKQLEDEFARIIKPLVNYK